ncbi:hypothetical protein RIF29_13196 [Crotalaria pallida]|uniref:GH18 domain-containing protein n=1 Tax=Crotalaria pallida TaxID=3830 RepID=A0AAN9IPA6_CROPI
MASKKQSYTYLLLALSTLSFIVNSSIAADCVGSGAISVYWGQHKDDETEGTLKETCDSGYYKIVILESLIVYDDGQTPTLNLANHCGPLTTPCSQLEETIKHCQDLGIKVFLSIGLNQTPKLASSNSSSSDDASVTKVLANYLLENFLSGNPGPLGSVFLDGIDIADVVATKNLQWDELVKAISEFTSERKIYLSAAPQCVYPDYYLGAAIQTGLFDYIWVEFFYQNPSCIYSDGSAASLIKEWKRWTSGVPNSKIFLGVTATKEIAGYIAPDVLKSDVLPTIRGSSNYGGVMVWDRYYDRLGGYSKQIKDSVGKTCRCVCDDELASMNFYALKARPFPM